MLSIWISLRFCRLEKKELKLDQAKILSSGGDFNPLPNNPVFYQP